MKLGIFSWYGFEAPFKYRITKIRKIGFDSIMLWGSDETKDDHPYDNILLKKLADINLEVENIHLLFDLANDLWTDNKLVREKYIQEHLNHIRQCHNFNIPMIVMHVSSGFTVKDPTNSGIDTMQIIIDEAERLGVNIAIENTRKINLVEAILDNIDCDYLGLCYDTSHGKLYETSEFYLLKKYPHRLKCLHISDNDGIEDRHWTIGKGVINWKNFIECFPDDYKGTLSLEVYPQNKDESEEHHLHEAFRGLVELNDMMDYK